MKTREGNNYIVDFKRLAIQLLLGKLCHDYLKGLKSSQGRLIRCLGPKVFALNWAKANISSVNWQRQVCAQFIS